MNVKFKKGTTSEINAIGISDGQLLIDTDLTRLYLDDGTTRKQVGGLRTVDTTVSTTSTNPIANSTITSYLEKSPKYTYSISNDSELNAWINNDSGNSYYSVLIKGGSTYGVSGATCRNINLTNTNTKIITCESNSYIYNVTFSYDAKPTVNLPNYQIDGLNLIYNGLTSLGSRQGLFENCINISNTTLSMTTGGSNYYMYNCDYINNAKITFSGGGGMSGIKNCNYMQNIDMQTNRNGFDTCNYLDNCKTLGGVLQPFTSYGFKSCTYLTNCYGVGATSSLESDTLQYYCGFYSCSYLTNCEGYGVRDDYAPATIHGTKVAFNLCNRLVNCNGSGSVNNLTYTSKNVSYLSCNYLENCITGTTTQSDSFGLCTHMSNCYCGVGDIYSSSSVFGCHSAGVVYSCLSVANCKASSYVSSYASSSTNATYLCADTPNGGFNATI